MTVLTIAAKDLRQRLRDKSAIVMGFLAPVAIAWVMSAAFGGLGGIHLDAAVVDQDGGDIAAAFTGMLASDELADLVTIKPASGADDARSKLDSGEVDAVFVLPPGFSAAARGSGAVPVTVLGSVDQPVARQVAAAVAEAFAARFNAVRLSVATALTSGADPATVTDLAAAAASREPPEWLTDTPTGTRPLSAISYFGPGMGIFFAMFAIGFTARGFHTERAAGTLDRMLAAPVRPASVLAGKSVAAFAYATASLTTMAVVTTVAFGAYWGPPWAAAALIVAMAVAMAALAALVIALSRTERQAEGLAAMLTFGLVLLGGNFVFVSAAPAALRGLALFTPNGWALRGFTDLATGAPASAVAVPVAVIAAFAAGTALIATAAARRIGGRR
ncbi:ABC transporter permease [Actinokineospora sp. HUAS TT18]|uniref:ABC transporter permease n=1 Tax=Actinokineospora sp. HUAS TT18 TaxID=3447451 RepID=UPI003F51F97A